VERLEDRTVLSGFTAASVADLIADINAANATGGANTITLTASTTFTLTSVDSGTDGANGLPAIAAGDDLTIVGSGDTIQRSTANGTPTFRLLAVESGGSLALANLTLQGGVTASIDRYGYVAGGAVYSQGSLSLSGVTVQDSLVQGVRGLDAEGGGICSRGALTAQDCIIRGNQAVGSDGASEAVGGARGGDALGGGLFVLGTASLTNVTLSSNTAKGGKGGNPGFYFGGHVKGGSGGAGLGGGLALGIDASVELHGCVVTGNTAASGGGGADGAGEGGGVYIVPLASACLDAFTVAHVTGNKASTSGPNIFGAYTTCP
jgi:hypothetical protein